MYSGNKVGNHATGSNSSIALKSIARDRQLDIATAENPLPFDLRVKIGLNYRDICSLRAVCQRLKAVYTPDWKGLIKEVRVLAYRSYKADPTPSMPGAVVAMSKCGALDLAIAVLTSEKNEDALDLCLLSNAIPANLNGIAPGERVLVAGRIFFHLRGLDLRSWELMSTQLAPASPHLLALLTKHPNARQVFWQEFTWKAAHAKASGILGNSFPQKPDWENLQQILVAAAKPTDRNRALFVLSAALKSAVLYKPRNTIAVDFACEAFSPARFFGFATSCLSLLPQNGCTQSGWNLAEKLAAMLAQPDMDTWQTDWTKTAPAVALVSSYFNYGQRRKVETEEDRMLRHHLMMPIAKNIEAIVKSIPGRNIEARRQVMVALMGYLRTKVSNGTFEWATKSLYKKIKERAKEEKWLGEGGQYRFNKLQ